MNPGISLKETTSWMLFLGVIPLELGERSETVEGGGGSRLCMGPRPPPLPPFMVTPRSQAKQRAHLSYQCLLNPSPWLPHRSNMGKRLGYTTSLEKAWLQNPFGNKLGGC